MDASMNSAIRATIPLLTAPLVDICSPSALDGLHVALMSTLSAHLSPTWDASRPSLGAPLRVLHLAPNTIIPRPLEKAAQQIRVKAQDWVSLLLAHNRTRAMSISVDPGMVAVQFAEQLVPTVYWQQDDLTSAARASSPISLASASSSSSSSSAPVAASSMSAAAAAAAAEAPWNARKSRLPSLVPGSARQASVSSSTSSSSSSAKMLVGSPRTPKSFNGFTFPPPTTSGAPQLSTDVLFGTTGSGRRVDEEEPSWMTSLLSMFPDAPAPASTASHSHSRAPSMQSASQGGVLRANAAVYRPPAQSRTAGSLRTAGAGHVRSESTESWASSTRSSPTSTSTQQRLSPVGTGPSPSSAAANSIYSQLAMNMSQLSLASTSTCTSSSSCAPSLCSTASTSSSSQSCGSSQRSTSPTSTTTTADELVPGADGFYHFDLSPSASSTSSPSSSNVVPNMVYYEDGLPSPVSPTASAYAYVDHAARKSVTEYECGKVGVLGGAVMLGVPAGAKKQQNRKSFPPSMTTNVLPQRGAIPNFAAM